MHSRASSWTTAATSARAGEPGPCRRRMDRIRFRGQGRQPRPQHTRDLQGGDADALCVRLLEGQQQAGSGKAHRVGRLHEGLGKDFPSPAGRRWRGATDEGSSPGSTKRLSLIRRGTAFPGGRRKCDPAIFLDRSPVALHRSQGASGSSNPAQNLDAVERRWVDPLAIVGILSNPRRPHVIVDQLATARVLAAPPPLSGWRRIGLNMLPWLILAIVFLPTALLLDRDALQPLGWRYLCMDYVTCFMVWAPYTALIGLLLQRQSIRWPPTLQACLVHLCCAVAMTLVHVLIMTGFASVVPSRPALHPVFAECRPPIPRIGADESCVVHRASSPASPRGGRSRAITNASAPSRRRSSMRSRPASSRIFFSIRSTHCPNWSIATRKPPIAARSPNSQSCCASSSIATSMSQSLGSTSSRCCTRYASIQQILLERAAGLLAMERARQPAACAEFQPCCCSRFSRTRSSTASAPIAARQSCRLAVTADRTTRTGPWPSTTMGPNAAARPLPTDLD